MRVIFFVKVSEILSTFQKCRKKIGKKLFVFEMIASEMAALISLY